MGSFVTAGQRVSSLALRGVLTKLLNPRGTGQIQVSCGGLARHFGISVHTSEQEGTQNEI